MCGVTCDDATPPKCDAGTACRDLYTDRESMMSTMGDFSHPDNVK